MFCGSPRNQSSCSVAAEPHQKRQSRREQCLARLDQWSPWHPWEKTMVSPSPKPGQGRSPSPLLQRLRVHGLQLFYNLGDPALAAARSTLVSLRRSGPIPADPPLLPCRPLRDNHQRSQPLLDDVPHPRDRTGLLWRAGTLVEAPMLSAPPAPPNHSGPACPRAAPAPARPPRAWGGGRCTLGWTSPRGVSTHGPPPQRPLCPCPAPAAALRPAERERSPPGAGLQHLRNASDKRGWCGLFERGTGKISQ